MVDRSPGDVGPVPGVVVGVDLHVKGEALHALLRAEVSAQALNGDVHLHRLNGIGIRDWRFSRTLVNTLDECTVVRTSRARDSNI